MIPTTLHEMLAPERWPAFVLVSARLSGLMLAAPLWSAANLPRALRAAIAVVLAAVLLPLCPPISIPERMLDLPLPVAMELVVGIAIGLTAAVLVQGVTLAGEVISLQMGLSLGPALSPLAEVAPSGLGQLQGFLALLVYLGIGGHLILLRGLAESLRILPPGSAIDLLGGARATLPLLSVLYDCALRAAGPVMVTLLVVNVAIAILARAVPQINAMMVSFPLTIGIGLLMLGASLPPVGAAVAGWMHELPAGVSAVVGGFRPER